MERKRIEWLEQWLRRVRTSRALAGSAAAIAVAGVLLFSGQLLAQAVTDLFEDFESGDFEAGVSDWRNVGGDDIDWRRLSGPTPSNNTGPQGDATTGSGFYIYTEASAADNGSPNREALLEGPCVDLTTAAAATFSFEYHMLGGDMGSLEAQVAPGCSSAFTTVFSRSGNQGNAYQTASIDLTPFLGQTLGLRLRAVTGPDFESDIAVDDLSVSVTELQGCSLDAQCDDGLFCNGTEICSAGFCAPSPVAAPCNGPGLVCDETIDQCVAAPVLILGPDDFEAGFGSWSNLPGDDIDWRRLSGPTPSANTGPPGDHTTGSGVYAYTEASAADNGSPNRLALLESPCIDLAGTSSARWTFFYHMFGSTMGTLEAQVDPGCTGAYETRFTRSGNQGNQYLAADVDLSDLVGGVVRLRFRAVTGTSFESDITIDDVQVEAVLDAGCSFDSDCDDGDVCTLDVCNAGTCESVPGNEGGSCDDGNLCTQTDTCQLGVCTGANPVTCAPAGVCRDVGMCNPATGLCSDPPAPDGTACDDGISCTTDACQAGSCQGVSNCPPGQTCDVAQEICMAGCSADVECDDGNACTVDTCSSGACQSTPDPTCVAAYPNVNDFDLAFGDWVNVAGDDIDWRRNTGPTPSNGTGPPADHTSGTGSYVYTEASAADGGSPNMEALLDGPCFDLASADTASWRFFYHMQGANMGSLEAQVAPDCSGPFSTVFMVSGDQGGAYNEASIDLTSFAGSRVAFRLRAVTGPDFASDIAVDDITVSITQVQMCSADAECDDGLFCNGAELCSGGICAPGLAPCTGAGLSCDESLDQCVAAPVAVLGPDDFDTGFGSWSNLAGDDIDWRRLSGPTPSANTGPPGDHTSGSGFYVYTEASAADGGSPNMEALLESPCIDLSGTSAARWTFFYHMLGSTMGTLEAQVDAGCTGTYATRFTRSGNQGSQYLLADVDLSDLAGSNVRLRFRAVTGSDFESDITIDDVLVEATLDDGSCSFDADCDDGSACTLDVCNAGTCENPPAPDGTTCSDADLCTQVDTCQAGVCIGASPIVCTASGTCRAAGVCDPSTGLCSDPPAPDGTACDDGVSCTDDTCQAGACQGVNNCPAGQSCDVVQEICIAVDCLVDIDCDDGNACTLDTCDGSGTCLNAPDPTCVAAFPNTNDFDAGFGDWQNVAGDDIDWRRLSGPTPSNGTGPPGDRTSGAGFYVYTEASAADGGSPNMEALLDGPCFDLASADAATWGFFYHMQGANMGSLEAQVDPGCSGAFQTVFSVSGDQGGAYNEASIDLSPFAGAQVALRFRAVTGPDFASDIAIDDVTVDITQLQTCGVDAECDDGLFCNGIETCAAGLCAPGADPCAGPGLACDESLDQCVAAPVAVLGPDDFDAGFGNWSNLTGDDIDWRRLSGPTPSANTGPQGDHTSGAGFYLYTEASAADGGSPNMEALLESPCIDLAGTSDARWTFFYHMQGSTMGTLEAQVDAGCTGSYATRFTRSGNQGNQYLFADVDLSDLSGGTVRLRFRAVTGSDFESDITIDDVTVEALLDVDTGCSFDSDCNDGLTCTADVCNAGTCENPPVADGTVCSDGNSCTQLDTCQAGICVGASPVVCTASDQCHDAGVCDPSTGLCSDPALPDGSVCDDGSLCTQGDVCQAGACTAGAPVVCTASDQCHDAGTCDPGTGLCSDPPKPDGAVCDDADLCTQSDTCQAGSCVGTSPVVCTSSDQCHDAGTCDPATGSCSNPAKPDGAACSDGISCTDDACQAGICQGVPNCPADQSCDVLQDICIGGGCMDDAECDDADPCTIDFCAADGQCGATPDPTCNANVVSSESFEVAPFGFTNVAGDDFDWVFQSAPNPGGPVGDHTTGTGTYALAVSQAGPSFLGTQALLVGPCVDLTSVGGAAWTFFYHQTGVPGGFAGSEFSILEAQVAPDCGATYSTRFRSSDDKGPDYQLGYVDLSEFAGREVGLRFVVTFTGNGASDIALDDVAIAVSNLRTPVLEKPVLPASTPLPQGGQADPGAEVEFFVDGNVRGTVDVGADGSFSASVGVGGPGRYTIEAVATLGGETSFVSAPRRVLVGDFPLEENAEQDIALFENVTNDQRDWVRLTGPVPNRDVFLRGPAGDNSTGSGGYMYAERGPADAPNSIARFLSSCIDLTNVAGAELRFAYHAFDPTFSGGDFNVRIVTSCEQDFPVENAFFEFRSRGDQWNERSVDLAPYLGGRLRVQLDSTMLAVGVDDVVVETRDVAAPTLDAIRLPITTNPFPVTGMAGPGQQVVVFLNGVEAGSTSAAADGSFSVDVTLGAGPQTLTATATDGAETSFASSAVQAVFGETLLTDPILPAALFQPAVLDPNVTYTAPFGLAIPPLASLRLPEGTTIRFEPGTSLSVAGGLLIEGDAPGSVRLQSAAPTPARGDWQGVRFVGDGSMGVRSIRGLEVSHAFDCLFFFDDERAVLENITLRECRVGLELDRAQVVLRDSTIENADVRPANATLGLDIFDPLDGTLVENVLISGFDGGVQLDNGGTAVVRATTIARSSKAFEIAGSGSGQIVENTVIDCALGMDFGFLSPPFDTRVAHNDFSGSDVPFFADNGSNVPVVDLSHNFLGTTDFEQLGALMPFTATSLFAHRLVYFPVLDAPFAAGGQPTPSGADVLSGVIASDRTLDPALTYRLALGAFVAPGATLTIPPGTRIVADDRTPATSPRLVSFGTLDARGTAADPIVFTSTVPDDVAGRWSGLRIGRGGSAVIDFALIEKSSDGVVADFADRLEITRSTIRAFSGDGIRFGSATGLAPVTGRIDDNVIDQLGFRMGADTDGVLLDRLSAPESMRGNTVRGARIGIRLSRLPQASDVTIEDSLIEANERGVQVELGGPLTLLHNRIVNNTGIGVLVAESVPSPSQLPVLRANELSGNGSFNLTVSERDATRILNAQQNFWGVPTEFDISPTISDQRMNPQLVRVEFCPFLDAFDGAIVACGNSEVPRNLDGLSIATPAELTPGPPYIVTGELLVESSGTLTIQPGTTVLFEPGARLRVEGALVAQSAAGDIVLGSNASAPQPGDWRGIVVDTSTGSLLLDGVTIRHAETGVLLLGGGDPADTYQILNSQILEVSRQGIQTASVPSEFSSPNPTTQSGIIAGNLIQNAAAPPSDRVALGVSLIEASPKGSVQTLTVSGNTIRGFNQGIFMRRSAPLVTGNLIEQNNLGINMRELTEPEIRDGNRIVGNESGIVGADSTAQPIVTRNAIFGNTSANFAINVGSGPLDRIVNAENNFWGTTDPLVIASKVTRGQRGTRAIDFVPFLDAEGGEPVIDERLLVGLVGAGTGDTVTLPARSDLLQVGALVVVPGSTLEIGSGSEIRVLADVGTDVLGGLRVLGTAASPVLITALDRSLPWRGIEILPGSTGAVVDHTRIEAVRRSSDVGILGIAINVTAADLQLSNCEILDFLDQAAARKAAVTFQQGATGSIENCLFDNLARKSTGARPRRSGTAIIVDNSEVSLVGNTIRETTIAIEISGPNNSVFSGNTVTSNDIGLFIEGTGVSGGNPSTTINGNNIFGNFRDPGDPVENIVVSNFGPGISALDARGNFFGETTRDTIRPTLVTRGDLSVPIDFSGFLSAANGAPAPDSAESFTSRIVFGGLDTREMESINGETVTYTFTTVSTTSVLVRIFRETDTALSQALRTFDLGFSPPQTFQLTWDGRNDAGDLLPDDGYKFVVTTESGGVVDNFDPPRPSREPGVFPSFPGRYAPLENDHLEFSYRVNPGNFAVPSKVNLLIGVGERIIFAEKDEASACLAAGTCFYAIEDRVLPVGETSTLSFDGRRPDGTLIDQEISWTLLVVIPIRPAAVLVRRGTPTITGDLPAPNIEVKSNPYLIVHSYEQHSNITYRLDRDAIVTVKLLTPGGFADAQEVVTLVDGALQQAKDSGGAPIDHVVTYLGYGTGPGESNDIISPVEGPYTFTIEARDPTEPNLRSVYRGVLNIRR